MVIGCDRVDRRKSGGNGSQAAAERSYRARLGKLEGRGSAIAEMGSRLGDKVEGTVTRFVWYSNILIAYMVKPVLQHTVNEPSPRC